MTFVRYVAVQLFAYAIDMGVFLLLVSSSLVGPIAANLCSKLLAGLFAFFVHRRFTFRVGDQSGGRRQAIQYFFLLALNIPISSALLSVLLKVVPQEAVAKVVADVACVLLSFAVSRYWVFRPSGDDALPARVTRDLP